MTTMVIKYKRMTFSITRPMPEVWVCEGYGIRHGAKTALRALKGWMELYA